MALASNVDPWSNPYWIKYAVPVLKYPVAAVTISPPYVTDLNRIRDLVVDWAVASSIKCFFVYEETEEHRSHWHGCVAIPKGKAMVEYYMKASLKSLLEKHAYVDWQRPRNTHAWISYINKGINNKWEFLKRRVTDHHLHCYRGPAHPAVVAAQYAVPPTHIAGVASTGGGGDPEGIDGGTASVSGAPIGAEDENNISDEEINKNL